MTVVKKRILPLFASIVIILPMLTFCSHEAPNTSVIEKEITVHAWNSPEDKKFEITVVAVNEAGSPASYRLHEIDCESETETVSYGDFDRTTDKGYAKRFPAVAKVTNVRGYQSRYYQGVCASGFIEIVDMDENSLVELAMFYDEEIAGATRERLEIISLVEKSPKDRTLTLEVNQQDKKGVWTNRFYEIDCTRRTEKAWTFDPDSEEKRILSSVTFSKKEEERYHGYFQTACQSGFYGEEILYQTNPERLLEINSRRWSSGCYPTFVLKREIASASLWHLEVEVKDGYVFDMNANFESHSEYAQGLIDKHMIKGKKVSAYVYQCGAGGRVMWLGKMRFH